MTSKIYTPAGHLQTAENLALAAPEPFFGRADRVIRWKLARPKNSGMRLQRGCG
jgi:hypothetical protein